MYAGENKSFSASAAKILIVENLTERLIDYVGRFVTANIISDYYRYFYANFPERTLDLFNKAIDDYVKENVGQKYYELTVSYLRKMLKLKGGKERVAKMIENYKILYKNRKAMIPMLIKIKI
jgi:hypothetical protein